MRSPAALFARLWSAPTLLIAVCALFWSANSVVGRAAHDLIGPAALSFWRWAVAAVLMALIARRQLALERDQLRRHWKILFACGLLGVGSFGLLLYIGLGHTTALNSILMQAAMPAVMMLMMLVVYGERPSAMALAGCGVAILGVLLIVLRGSITSLAGFTLNIGDAITLVAVLLYAVYSLAVARAPKLHPLVFASATFAFAAASLLPAWIAEMLLIDEPPFGGMALAAILFVAIFPSCIAYVFYNRAVELAGPSRASNFSLMMPLFGSLLAVIFLDERLALYHVAGGALILAGVILGRRKPISPRTPAR